MQDDKNLSEVHIEESKNYRQQRFELIGIINSGGNFNVLVGI